MSAGINAKDIKFNPKSTIQEPLSRKIFVIFNSLFFCAMTFLCFYPLYYVLIQSLSGGIEGTKAVIWPINFTFENYVEMLSIPDITHAIGVSVLRTVLGTIGHVMCCMLLGYLFTLERMPFRKIIYRFMIITMYVGGGLIPTYLVFKFYGLVNSFWVYVIPGLISMSDVILVKTFVESIPTSLEESARLDGASTLRIFLSIIMPLSLPIAATLAVYASNSQWNSWWDNQLYNAGVDELTTLQMLLYTYLNQAEAMIERMYEDHTLDTAAMDRISYQMTGRGLKMTVTMISVIPILCVYPFMQRYLIKGIMIGAVKG